MPTPRPPARAAPRSGDRLHPNRGQWRNTEPRTVWVVADLSPCPWAPFSALTVGDVTASSCWNRESRDRALLNMSGEVHVGQLQVAGEVAADVLLRWLQTHPQVSRAAGLRAVKATGDCPGK